MGSKTLTKMSTMFNQLGFVGANQRELYYITVIFSTFFFAKQCRLGNKVSDESLKTEG